MASLSTRWWICSSQCARRAMNVTRNPDINVWRQPGDGDQNWPIWSSPGIKRSTTNFALLAASLPTLTPRRFRHMLDREGHPRFILANQRVTLKPLSQSVSLLLGNVAD